MSNLPSLLRRPSAAVLAMSAAAFTAVPAMAQEHAASHSEVAATHGEHAAVEGDPAVFPKVQEGLVTGLTTLVVFLILLAILSKVAFGPIAAGLKKREDKIRKDISDAEAAMAKANAVLAQYNAQVANGEAQVRAMMAEATANAEKIKASIKAQADAEAAELREKAKREIEAEKNTALREIQEQAVYISTAIAEKILRKSISADDNRDLVRSSLEQLASVHKN